MAEPLTLEDIANVDEVLQSQLRLGHSMTLMPTDVLSRLLDAARAAAPLDVVREVVIDVLTVRSIPNAEALAKAVLDEMDARRG